MPGDFKQNVERNFNPVNRNRPRA